MRQLSFFAALTVFLAAGAAAAQTMQTTTGDLNRRELENELQSQQQELSRQRLEQWQTQQQSVGTTHIPAWESYRLIENPRQPLLEQERQDQLQQRQQIEMQGAAQSCQALGRC